MVKGYYYNDEFLVKKIRDDVTGIPDYDGPFKTIESQIMDIADDIAYSTYDLEDAMKAGFLNPLDCLSIKYPIAEKITDKLNFTASPGDVMQIMENLFGCVIYPFFSEHFPDDCDESILTRSACDSLIRQSYSASNDFSANNYYRTFFTSFLVDTFIHGVEFEICSDFPCLTRVFLRDEIKLQLAFDSRRPILTHFWHFAI